MGTLIKSKVKGRYSRAARGLEVQIHEGINGQVHVGVTWAVSKLTVLPSPTVTIYFTTERREGGK